MNPKTKLFLINVTAVFVGTIIALVIFTLVMKQFETKPETPPKKKPYKKSDGRQAEDDDPTPPPKREYAAQTKPEPKRETATAAEDDFEIDPGTWAFMQMMENRRRAESLTREFAAAGERRGGPVKMQDATVVLYNEKDIRTAYPDAIVDLEEGEDVEEDEEIEE